MVFIFILFYRLRVLYTIFPDGNYKYTVFARTNYAAFFQGRTKLYSDMGIILHHSQACQDGIIYSIQRGMVFHSLKLAKYLMVKIFLVYS